MRAKLNALLCRKTELKSHMEQLKRLRTSVSTTEAKTKDGIVGLLENAVFELRAAASGALDAAMAKVGMADLAGFESIDGLVRRITNLLTEVGKMHDVCAELKGLKVSGDG